VSIGDAEEETPLHIALNWSSATAASINQLIYTKEKKYN
jgi:hypothetical protein